MPISASGPKSGHTFYYIRKQSGTNISRDSPTFHRLSIGTLMVTFLGISQLYCCPSIVTQIVPPPGISQHFYLQPNGTLLITSNLSAIVLQTNDRDTFWDISSISQTKKPTPVWDHSQTGVMLALCSLNIVHESLYQLVLLYYAVYSCMP